MTIEETRKRFEKLVVDLRNSHDAASGFIQTGHSAKALSELSKSRTQLAKLVGAYEDVLRKVGNQSRAWADD